MVYSLIISSLLISVLFIGNSLFTKYIFEIDYYNVGYISGYIFNYYDWFMSFSYEEFIAFYGRYTLVIILVMPLLLLTNKPITKKNSRNSSVLSSLS